MITPNMAYSRTGEALTTSFEGCALSAYQDQKGIWTIGYGHTKNVAPGDTCTSDQALLWLEEDMSWAVNVVNREVSVNLSQNEFDALVDFVFNVGSGAFQGSTLLRLLNSGDYAGASREFDKWDHVSGAVVAGLLRRREAETSEFLSL